MAAPGVRGSFASTAGGSQTTAVSATLPAGIVTGDIGYLIVSFNSGTATITTPPSGWTLVDGPVNNGSNNLRSYLYRRVMASSDSSASVTATLSTGLRWTIGGIVLSSAAETPDVSIVSWLDNTDDLSLSIPSITPATADDRLIVLAGVRYATTTTGVTATNGWGEHQDSATSNGTAPRFGVWIGSRALTGQAGVAQAAVDMTYAGNARNNAWLIAVKSGAPPAGTGTGSWSFAGAAAGETPGPGLRANALGNNGASSSWTTSITIPATAATDGTDYAVAAFALDTGTNSHASVDSAPAGWDLLAGPSSISGAPLLRAYLYGKTIEPGEPGTTVNWTWTGNTTPGSPGHMSVYRNVTETGMLVATPTVDSTSGTSIVLPSQASVPAGALVHAHFVLNHGSTIPDVTTPTGYTAGSSPRVVSDGIFAFASVEHAYKVVGTAGTYGGETATINVSARGIAYLVVLPDADAVPPPSGTSSGTWAFTGTASGTSPRAGAATGAWSFTGTAAGQSTRSGTTSGSWAFTGAAAGTTTRSGTATGSWAYSGTGTGTTTQTGAATGTWAYTGAADGHTDPGGSATGAWQWLGAALGTSATPEPPAHTVGQAVIATHLGTATLHGDGIHTATLVAAAGTATLLAPAGTATLAAAATAEAAITAVTGTASLAPAAATATIDTD